MLLTNAKDVKNVLGKMKDEEDAEWSMLMNSYGLLKPSFHLYVDARSIHELARHRDNAVQESLSSGLYCSVTTLRDLSFNWLAAKPVRKQ